MDKRPKNESVWIPTNAVLNCVTKRIEMVVDGCVKLFELPPGSKILVQTQNHEYLLDKIGEKEYLICGHPVFCPHPVKVIVSGATWGSSFLWVDRLGWGMFMEFRLVDDNLVLRTSSIVDIKIL